MSALRHGPPLAMNGYMDKEGRKFRARKTRYFKLKDSALFNHRRKDSLPTWGVSLIDSRVAVGHKSEVIVQLFDGKKLFLYPHSRSDCDRWVDLLQRASRRKIGNYYGVTGLVGMGSFAEVRIGYDKSTGQQVAIKVMKKNKRDTELMRSVECEMNFISKNIDHENIVATYDVFDTRDNLFIVMEYMPGGMLYDILANEGYFTEKNAASVMKDLLYSVECLHDNDIVHRDIKPENVLALNKTWPLKVKLADFGLADFVLENSFGEKSTCGMYGTPFFVAPEVIKAETYTPAVDIWSLGVLAYNMLSGKLPFDGNNIKEVLRRVRSGRYTFPDSEWGDISDEAKDFIRGLLEVDPKRRFTAKEALSHAWMTSANISERVINNDRSALGYEQRKLRMSSMAIDDVAGLLRLEEEDEVQNGTSSGSHHHHHGDHGIRALSRLFPGKSGKSSRSSGSTKSRQTGDYDSLPPRHDSNHMDTDSPPAFSSREQAIHNQQLQPPPQQQQSRSNRNSHTPKRPPPSPMHHQQSRPRPQTPSSQQQQNHQPHMQQGDYSYNSVDDHDPKEIDNSAAVSNAAPLRLNHAGEEEGTISDLSNTAHPYNAPSDLPGWNDAIAAAANGGSMAHSNNNNMNSNEENGGGGGGGGYRGGGLEFNEQFMGANGADGFALPAILSVRDIMRRRKEDKQGIQQQHVNTDNTRRRRNGGGNDTSDSEGE